MARVDAVMRQITDSEFALFQSLIYGEAGIYLTESKKALLVGRLNRRLRELGLRSFAEYYRFVAHHGEEEMINLLDSVSTNETHFFREPKQFELLEKDIFPKWLAQAEAKTRSRLIRVWSAGCSSGEEPYSVAMSLLTHFSPTMGWEVNILATDLSTRVLTRAEQAVWPLEKAVRIPDHYLKRFMLKGTGSRTGYMKAGPELRSVIRFRRLNLNHENYGIKGLFDLILCRNVLIYFHPESRARVIDRLTNYLTPAGYLFLGHAESLSAVTDRVCTIAPTVYVRSEHKRAATEAVSRSVGSDDQEDRRPIIRRQANQDAAGSPR